jgi:hypothetical protein
MTDQNQAGTEHAWTLGSKTSDTMVTHLRFAAQTAANEALRSFDSDEPAAVLWCATAAGIATETIMKYCLASANPAFISSNVDSAIRLARGVREQIALDKTRTLTGQDAARAVRLLHSDHPKGLAEKYVDEVLAVRNIAAHIGSVDPDRLSTAMQSMVVVIGACLEASGDDEEFWDDRYEQLLDELEREDVERSRLELERKKAAASRLFEGRKADLLPEQVITLMKILEASALRHISPPEVIGHECPVCGYQGVLMRYVTESDTDFTGSRYPDEHPTGIRYAYPDEFSCAVCGLILVTDEIAEEHTFDDVDEEEVEPSNEFEEALADWKYEAEQEQRRQQRLFDVDDWFET